LKTYDSLTSKIFSKNQTDYSLNFLLKKELKPRISLKIEELQNTNKNLR